MSRQTVPADRNEASALIAEVESLLANAAACRQRAVVIVSGERDQGVGFAAQLIDALSLSAHWYSDQAPQQARVLFGPAAFSLLGAETGALVFDAFAGFDPDAFGALTGSIRAGGLLLLITPPLADWAAFDDPQNERITVAPYSPRQLSGRFIQRLVRLLRADRRSMLIEAGRLTRSVEAGAPLPAAAAPAAEIAPCLTLDQKQAVDALLKVATGHRRRPVVLTSDRGRGKSAAFGIAAAQLLQQGKQQLVVTAPRSQSADTVLQQAERIRPGSAASLCFIPPDALVEEARPADLVLVDEAAAIPTPLLERLLKMYPRIAFATTVHGYEGTGRGFAVRFSRILDANTNSWKALELVTPVRWAQDDPLEALTFSMLGLDAEPAADTQLALYKDDEFEMRHLDRDTLIEDTALLAELFGLLVQAHYRTRPLDLRHLLDGPNLDVYILSAGGHVAATALVATEGGFDAATARAVWAGRHRPHGHLLPETLAAHQGLLEAPLLRCGRIMRVTVHPALQRRGLGSRLVTEISARLGDRGYDYIGTSFGVTPGLLDFWQRLDWRPVRLSIQKGASSGSHSAVYMKALSAAGSDLHGQARRRFFAQFPHQLSDSLRDLDAALVSGLLRDAGAQVPDLDEEDRRDLQAFSAEQRLAEVTIGSLWRLALHALMTGRAHERLDSLELSLVIIRVLQKQSWSDTAARCGLTGRKQALTVLRAAVGKLLD